MKIAINGFGRIGRAVVRNLPQDVELIAINDLMDVEMMAYLLEFDSVHRKFNKVVEVIDEKTLQIGDRKVKISNFSDPSLIDWEGADVVIEATGRFLSYELSKGHLNTAKKVILSAPATDDTPTFVYGVNHLSYNGEKLISNASCTTNCLAPIAMILDKHLGIEKALMTTIHSYTIDQNLLDSAHKREFRRARAAAINIIPTTTGAAKALHKVLPTLKDKFDGRSVRVPVADVSIMDLNLVTTRKSSKEELINLFKKYAFGSLKGILGIDESFKVSQDIIGSSFSSIVATDLIQVIDGNLIKVMSWYDNEYGYANRLIDMAKFITKEQDAD
ncbi:MAG: type I glyceraldehyde-3-phosphate dehydrogenase [Epsilonproteobacteria bacterium]|nr:type I glyceraldehyde-3-phosphate dehydrogenase [Campylobacterota bacterium]